jgi:hypothetical protein
MNQELLRLRLKGRRFDGHSLPLEILKDFAALGEMLVEIAKTEYLLDNPSRKRIPKGFSQNLEIHLIGVEEGIAILNLALPVLATVSELLSQNELHESQYIERAWNKVGETISASEQGQTLSLTPNHLRYFDRFGRSLREGESIEFPFFNGNIASFTPQVRENLLVASQAEEWTEEVILKGRIPEVDQKYLTFELEIKNSFRLKSPLEEQYKDTVLAAFNDYRRGKGSLVAIKGIVKRNRAGNYKFVESITEMMLLDSLDVETQLEDFIELKGGWFNGQGEPFNCDDLRKLAKDFEKNFNADLPLPYFYPTSDGEVRAEWDIGRYAVSLDIELPSQNAYYHQLHLDTKEDVESYIKLSEDGWKELNGRLQTITKEVDR